MSHLVYIIIYMYNVIFFIRVFRLNNVLCVLDGRVMSHLVYIIRYIMLYFLLGVSALIMCFCAGRTRHVSLSLHNQILHRQRIPSGHVTRRFRKWIILNVCKS